jgi:oligopeptide transport system substrate-binding protein
MWRQNLNVAATLVNQEEKVYFDSRRQMNYQVIRSTWIGDYVDPNSFLDLWVTNGTNNQTGWSNPDYDRLIAEASQTGDQAARYAAFQKAEGNSARGRADLAGLFLHPRFLDPPERERLVSDDS